MKNAIFDFDGTLGDSKDCGNIAIRESFAHFGLSLPTTEMIEYYMGLPIEQSFVEMADRELSAIELEKLFTEFRRLYKLYEMDHLTLFPGTLEMLSSLTGAGLQLFVASSKHSVALQRNLEILGIQGFFTEVVGSDMVENYKPHPESIERIIDKYELSKAETIMIGDAIFDLQMGKLAAIKTCAVTWGSHAEATLIAENPDFVAHDMLELTEILTQN